MMLKITLYILHSGEKIKASKFRRGFNAHFDSDFIFQPYRYLLHGWRAPYRFWPLELDNTKVQALYRCLIIRQIP